MPAPTVSKRELVDQDEAAQRLIDGVRLKHQRRAGGDIHHGNFIERERFGSQMLAGVDVLAVLEVGDGGGHLFARVLHQVLAPGCQGVLAHPQQPGLKLVGHLGRGVGRHQHVAAAGVHLVGQRQR
jgi:hypothetical protein